MYLNVLGWRVSTSLSLLASGVGLRAHAARLRYRDRDGYTYLSPTHVDESAPITLPTVVTLDGIMRPGLDARYRATEGENSRAANNSSQLRDENNKIEN